MDLSERYPGNNIDAAWIRNISMENSEAALTSKEAATASQRPVRVMVEEINNIDTVNEKKQSISSQTSQHDLQQWITHQQTCHENAEFGECRPEVELALKEQRIRSKEVEGYKLTFQSLLPNIEDEQQKNELNYKYLNLVGVAKQRLTCLENNSKIVHLDNLFGPVTQAIHNTSVNLVKSEREEAVGEQDLSINVGYNAQQCILATRRAWDYLIQQLSCVERQLKIAAEYHQFFSEVHQYKQWMMDDLGKVDDVIRKINDQRNVQREDPLSLLPEIKMALATYLNWRGRIDAVYERSKKVLPVDLRTRRLDSERYVTSLSGYHANELKTREGEELVVMDNSAADRWKVRNLKGDISYVPSVQLIINGPDLHAIDAAMKLRFLFFNSWIDSVRRLGKVLINYLLNSFKNWNTKEENQFSSLNKDKKEKSTDWLTSIFRVFSPYWDVYPPFKTLRSKMEKLTELLSSKSSLEYRDDESLLPVLVGNAKPIQELVETYKRFWDNWEQFRCLSDARHRPENLLSQNDWEKYRLLASVECLQKWQTDMMKEDDDLDLVDGHVVEDEIYMMKTAKEQAETSQLSTSEMEERQTFVITGVLDPRNGKEISLDRAVSIGIINQRDGKYVNPKTRESIPIPIAMASGKIKVEFITTNKSAEKKSDLALITLKTFSESRPFTVKGIVDAKSERHLTVEEAIKAGILDQKKGVYLNTITMQEMSMADALDSGLLLVEFEQNDGCPHENKEDDVVTKTYAIHAVLEPGTSRRLSFLEAVNTGLMDAETGAYTNSHTGEIVSVGDAIKCGLLKASIVTNPKSFDISPGKKLNLENPYEQKLRNSIGQSIQAVSAFQEVVEEEQKKEERVHDVAEN